MNESFYKMYKSGRDLVEKMRHKELHKHNRDFVNSIEANSLRLDRSNPEYFERWKKESLETSRVLFRLHRGCLDDSMNTVVEIESRDHLFASMQKSWEPWHLEVVSMEIKPYGYDERINWDTQIVTVEVCDENGSTSRYPAGFLNKPFPLNDTESSNEVK